MEENQIKQIYSIIAAAYQQQIRQLDSKAYYETLTIFLKEEDYMLVANNLKEHIRTNEYIPQIKHLVAKKEELRPYIPNAQETRNLIASEDVCAEKPTKEQMDKIRADIEAKLKEGKEQHEQRVAKLY